MHGKPESAERSGRDGHHEGGVGRAGSESQSETPTWGRHNVRDMGTVDQIDNQVKGMAAKRLRYEDLIGN